MRPDIRARGLRVARIAARSFVIGLVVALTAVAAPAHAAGFIGISDDGVTFGPAYPGTLFDSTAHLVPMDSDTEAFFIRNDTTQPAFLRIVMTDVTFTDAAFGAALSLSASTPAETGQPKALSTATPCIVLVEGQTVLPGEVVPITTVLALGNLTGAQGQNATAALTMRIELHETTTGSLPATACVTSPTTPTTEVVVVPPARPTGTGQQVVDVPPTTGVETPEEPGTLPSDPQGSIDLLDPNTWLLYEERWWFLMLLAFVVGSMCFMIIDWLRQRRAPDDETETSA